MIKEFSEVSPGKSSYGAFLNVLLACLFLSSFLAGQAFALAEASSDASDYTDPAAEAQGYYYVHDAPQVSKVTSQSFASQTFAWTGEVLVLIRAAAEELIDLLNWDYINGTMPVPSERYNRKTHFGPWAVDRTNGNCYDTRSKALVRDSRVPVKNSSNGCYVSQGEWFDPYSGNTFTSSRDIQIDHVVALNNAYKSGAFSWDFHRRCVYANFLANNFHLLSVSGTENIRKLDYTPERWMPLDPNYRCQHLWNWVAVKMIWHLMMTPGEVQAIKLELQKNSCDLTQFKFMKDQLFKQRDVIENTNQICQEESTGT